MNKRPRKFRIVSVGPADIYYKNRKQLIGRTCIAFGPSAKTQFSADLLVSGWNLSAWLELEGPLPYRYFFHRVKLLAL